MTSLAVAWDWGGRAEWKRSQFVWFFNGIADFLRTVGSGVAKDQTVRCLPLPGETACACESDKSPALSVASEPPLIIEGWIAFPTAIADGTATGTVFLEMAPELGLRSRVVANLAVERGGIQNWIHFRLPFDEQLEVEGAYGVRATLVATDALTGEKRLFGTTRAASVHHHKAAAGLILELEQWG